MVRTLPALGTTRGQRSQLQASVGQSVAASTRPRRATYSSTYPLAAGSAALRECPRAALWRRSVEPNMTGKCPLPLPIPDWLLHAHRDREGWRWTRIESQRLRASPSWGSVSYTHLTLPTKRIV